MERELCVQFIEKGEEREGRPGRKGRRLTPLHCLMASVSRREIMGGGRNGGVEAPLTARNRTDARCMGLGRFGFGRGRNIGSGTTSIAAASVARRGSARAVRAAVHAAAWRARGRQSAAERARRGEQWGRLLACARLEGGAARTGAGAGAAARSVGRVRLGLRENGVREREVRERER
jgi:hypothetical protein